MQSSGGGWYLCKGCAGTFVTAPLSPKYFLFGEPPGLVTEGRCGGGKSRRA